jgi:hypothetical protein
MERSIRERLADVHARIEAVARRAGRDPSNVRLIVVTKNRAIDDIRELLMAGRYALGENRVQEALDKIKELPLDTEWHLIGHLQRNKAKLAIRNFALIHSLDSERLTEELQRAADAEDRIVETLIEVNISGERTKEGLKPEAVEPLLARIVQSLHRLRVRGLMTMAPYVTEPESVRPVFRKLCSLRDRLQESGYALPHLSMGMTNDFEIAVEEGATMVRIGTAVFEDI